MAEPFGGGYCLAVRTKSEQKRRLVRGFIALQVVLTGLVPQAAVLLWQGRHWWGLGLVAGVFAAGTARLWLLARRWRQVESSTG
jgi:hypothetical protein